MVRTCRPSVRRLVRYLARAIQRSKSFPVPYSLLAGENSKTRLARAPDVESRCKARWIFALITVSPLSVIGNGTRIH